MCWKRSEPSPWSTRKCDRRRMARATRSSGSSTMGARIRSGTWPPRTAACRSSDRSRAGSVSMVAVTTASIDSGTSVSDPVTVAFTSSCRNRGLPPLRSTRSSTTPGGRTVDPAAASGQLREVVAVQRREPAAHHGVAVGQLETAGHGPSGDEHRPRAAADLREEALEQLAGRGVEPVGVLDRDEGRLREDPPHQVDDGLLQVVCRVAASSWAVSGVSGRSRPRGTPRSGSHGARCGAVLATMLGEGVGHLLGRRLERHAHATPAGLAAARSTAWPGCTDRPRTRSRPSRGRAPTWRRRASTCRCRARR